MRMLTVSLLMAFVLAGAYPLAAATILGKVTVPAVAESSSGAASGYSRGVYRPGAKSKQTEKSAKDLTDIVIWAEPVGSTAPFQKPSSQPKMIQQNKAFVPHVLPVQTGTEVDFPNLDPLYHNVFSYSRAKRFDLGRYSEGKSKSVIFDEPGVIDVFCEIHENMHAYVLVVDSPWFTRSASDGTFRIELPAGEYRVFAWTPNRKSEPVDIKLSESTEAKVDFSF